jgi:branched-chain amino acid transport system ATP-binding protein
MTGGRGASTYRPLWIGGATLVVLPFAMQVLGLSVNTASAAVILAVAALGLNLLVGYTGPDLIRP